MGGVFAANMTGNTVLAGIALAQGRYLDAGRHLAPLVAFFVGAMLARLMLRLWHKRSLPILVEAAMIAIVAALPIGVDVGVLILALAMGLQATAITHFGGTALSTVVVTSTLARAAEAALDKLLPAKAADLPEVAKADLLVICWAGYLAGAAAGALLLQFLPWPLIVPAVLLLLVAL